MTILRIALLCALSIWGFVVSSDSVELAALKASLVDRDADYAPWPFSPTERRIFGMLLASDFVSKETIALVVRGAPLTANSLKSIDVFVSRIRGKTAASKLKIDTIHGRGYRLCEREAWSKAITMAKYAN